jgi:ribosome recycling factor
MSFGSKKIKSNFSEEEKVSAIRSALTDLNSIVEKLEGSVAVHEEKVQEQHELFEKSAANANVGVDPAILAQKLDVTIQRVEEILKEG